MTAECWRQTTVGQIMKDRRALRTGPFGSQLHASDYVSEGVPVVMPRDFPRGMISCKNVARVSTGKAAELADFRVRTGDVLLARRGEMGRCTHVEASQDGWLCGTGVLRIRPSRDLDGKFLTHLLRSPGTVAWLTDHAVGQTLPSLNVGTVSKIPLLVPPINEQQRIVKVLSAIEETIDGSRQVIRQKQRLRNRFWQRLLTHGPDLRPAMPGLNPTDWKPEPIGSLCTMSNGFPFKARDRSVSGLPIIRIGNLNGSRRFNFFAGPPARGWTVEPGDLLFAWAGVKGSSFGPCLWPGPKGVLNQHIFRVQPNRKIVKEWLFEAFKLVTRKIEERARGFKSDLQHVRKSEVTEQLVPVPPFEVQQWIAAQSRVLASIEAAERDSLASLVRLKQGLAHELLSGRAQAPSPRR